MNKATNQVDCEMATGLKRQKTKEMQVPQWTWIEIKTRLLDGQMTE